MKFFLLVSCAVVCAALSFMWHKPWLGGVGLLCGFATMWIDRDPVRVGAGRPQGIAREFRQRVVRHRLAAVQEERDFVAGENIHQRLVIPL